MGRTPAEMDTVRRRVVPASALIPVRRRRIVEESSVLAALILYDCRELVRLHTLTVSPFSAPTAPAAGFRLRLTDGWASLSNPYFASDLRALHHLLEMILQHVCQVCLRGESDLWIRPRVATSDCSSVDLPLRASTRRVLEYYLAALRPDASTRDLVSRLDRYRLAHIYPLAGLAYSMCVSQEGDGVFLYVRVNVFSDLGGAGVSVLDGKLVKIRKGVGTLSPMQLRRRGRFQRDYLTRLRSGTFGEEALFPTAVGA